MVHRAANQHKRFLHRIGPVLRPGRVRRDATPGVLLAVDEGQARIGEVVAAVAVDGGGVRGVRNVEGVAADDGFVVEGDGAGDEGQLGRGHRCAGLQVAPLGAVLVGPAAPGLGDVVLRVEGGVVVGVAVVCGLAAGEAGLHEGGVDVADVIEHLRREGCGLRGVAAGCDEVRDYACEVCGGGVEGAVSGDLAAILRERRTVDGGVPVATLPASDSGAECVGEVGVVSEWH